MDLNMPGLRLLSRGKVRNAYLFGKEEVLVVATDRLSAFDRPLGKGMEGKGKVLTAMTVHWFGEVSDIRENYMVSCGVPEGLERYEELLAGRTILAQKVSFLPVEFVVRGYLYGSAWREYRERGSVSGLRLGAGMVLGERLPEPAFTPTMKVRDGHDVAVSEGEYFAAVGKERGKRLREASIELFRRASSRLHEEGIILADTKMEFGILGEKEVLVNELFTPDSSRFWLRERYRPGEVQESMDKQPLRDYLRSQGWRGEGPPPDVPDEVLSAMAAKYRHICRIVTGRDV